MAQAGVTAVLLPGTSFFLMKHTYAPARRLVEAGVPVALATDCNPGSSNTESMPMIFVLAVFVGFRSVNGYGFTYHEASLLWGELDFLPAALRTAA